MNPSQYQSAALVLAMASFMGSVPILKRGSGALTIGQKAELHAMGPDRIAMFIPLLMMGAAYFSHAYPWPMAMVVIIALLVSLYRVPYRHWKMPWPTSARRYLVIGNCVMSGGIAIAALLYISQFL